MAVFHAMAGFTNDGFNPDAGLGLGGEPQPSNVLVQHLHRNAAHLKFGQLPGDAALAVSVCIPDRCAHMLPALLFEECHEVTLRVCLGLA
jgi:hypothetical protein